MSLKHLRAMRDYHPPVEKDFMATAFLWILAERAGSGATYKNGYKSEFGWTEFLSDKKFMEQLGIDRQESLRQLRLRFRTAGAIQTERKHTKGNKKSKWPVYRYFLGIDWLKSHAERSKSSHVERLVASHTERAKSEKNRTLNADLTRISSCNPEQSAPPPKEIQGGGGSSATADAALRSAGDVSETLSPTTKEIVLTGHEERVEFMFKGWSEMTPVQIKRVASILDASILDSFQEWLLDRSNSREHPGGAWLFKKTSSRLDYLADRLESTVGTPRTAMEQFSLWLGSVPNTPESPVLKPVMPWHDPSRITTEVPEERHYLEGEIDFNEEPTCPRCENPYDVCTCPIKMNCRKCGDLRYVRNDNGRSWGKEMQCGNCGEKQPTPERPDKIVKEAA